ncbi:MAG: nitroreductase family protein [Chloroflexi bacterium]|nr:nitroreductase family protein [Chloroflexota bacterium]
MELKEVIKKRQSIRDYEEMPVPEEKLLKVLEAARLAPSASNRQQWKFIIVREANSRQQLALAAGGQAHVAKAPVVIAAVAMMPEYVMWSGVPAYAVDLAIAVDHITLAAVDEGLGTCWIGSFSQDEVRDILKVPEHYRIVALLSLGFPRQTGEPKIRKSLSQIVCYEIFKE